MATAADSHSGNHSPRSNRATRNLCSSSPWAHVVRGESEVIPAGPSSPLPSPPAAAIPFPDRSSPTLVPASSDAAPPPPPLPALSEIPDQGNSDNAARGMKPAWSKPSNGSTVEVRPVMGAVSWPPLSESTRAAPKLSSSDPLKALSDGSVSAPPVPVIASPPPKPNTSNPNPHSTTPNHVAPARQKPMKGGSSGSTPATGGPTLSLPPPTPAEIPQIAPDKQAAPGLSPKDNKTSNSWDHGPRGGGFMPQPYAGNEHHRNYSGGNRRGNNGGGGSHHNNYGNRRDPERGGYEWNHHRNFSGRDVHMQPPPQPQQQRGFPRAFLRPHGPASAPFITPTPPPARPFVSPMGFPEMSSPVYYLSPHPPPESFRGVPFVTHAAHPAMYFPVPDPHRAALVKQIEYYFSPENLCKDIHLRQNMDEQGWVPISVIAGFNRIKQLTNNIHYILDIMRASIIVEVQGEKIRKRDDWMNWILTPPPFGYSSGSQSPATSNYDTLVARMQSVGLEEGATNHNSMRGSMHTELVLSRSASGNLNNQVQVARDPNGEDNGQVTGHTDSDRSNLPRSLCRSDTL